MKTVCEINKCAGCMACIDICPKEAIKIKDDLSVYNAMIQEDKCIDCNACHQVCPSNHLVKLMQPVKWYQGWSIDSDIRKKCSSGGLATAISVAFIENNGIVCSCTFKNGEFIFEFAENKDDVKKFIGSKYVKSNPVGVYKMIRDRLKNGQKILFIGLPCQVSAMRNFVGKQFAENLYTADLICHGTPSPKLLALFLKQYGYTLSDLKDIQFRVKSKYMIYSNCKGIITNGVSDKYSIAFLHSLIYTENCYSCLYARKERISDLTLGDSWGSEITIEEQKKGISLILSQTEKGDELLKMADIHLETVDIDKAIANNHQLEYPPIMPNGREQFFKGLNKKKFNSLVFRQCPKQCIRQNVKKILIKLQILKHCL